MGDAWGQAQPPSWKGHPDHSKFIIKQLHGSGSQCSILQLTCLILGNSPDLEAEEMARGTSHQHITATLEMLWSKTVHQGQGRSQGHKDIVSPHVSAIQAPKHLGNASTWEFCNENHGEAWQMDLWRAKHPLPPEGATHCSMGRLSA